MPRPRLPWPGTERERERLSLIMTPNISFLPAIASTSTRMHGEFLRLLCLQATGRPRRTSLPMECHRHATNRNRSGTNTRGILPVAEEQSRTRGGPSGGIVDQPQCRGLWHSSSPSARSLSRSPSSPPPSFTKSPSPPRSLVRHGQTSPHRPRLVVSRSTCPPLFPPHPREHLCIGTAVINTHSNINIFPFLKYRTIFTGISSGILFAVECGAFELDCHRNKTDQTMRSGSNARHSTWA